MNTINKAVKEWNAVIEALGDGKQSILIRKYETSNKKFLLYPTVSYAVKDDYLGMFKNNYRDFVEKNAFPLKNEDDVIIKYYAELVETVKKPYSQISSIEDFHIWTDDHVKSYLNGNKAFVWVLRVYELDQPLFAERNNGMLYANLKIGTTLDGMVSVLTDKEFTELKSNF